MWESNSLMSVQSKGKLIKFLELIGLDFECLFSTKEGRTKIQDIVYLAAVQGIDLGYKEWHWYPFNRGA